MPIYEYRCQNCSDKFELLRRLGSNDDDVVCPKCKGKAQRLISTFASFSKDQSGMTTPIGGGGSCAGCSSNSCSSCH